MDNFVPIGDVLLVLRAKGIAIAAQDEQRGKYLLAGNGLLEVRILPPLVPKVELRYLSRKFRIDIFLFWNPNLLQLKPGENPN